MFSALAFSLWQKNEYEDSDKAIVMRTVYVRSTPSAESSQKTLFELHAGTKVHVLEIMGPSMRISIADGRQGWVNTSDIEII
jgi:SH3-like domain-containing protein